MNDTVVLGGDYTSVDIIDGDLDLLLGTSPQCELHTILDGDADLIEKINGDASLTELLDGEVGIITTIHGGAYPEYTGPKEITPTTEAQTLSTASTSVLDNIVIRPIPNNYGLITWDGATITVS